MKKSLNLFIALIVLSCSVSAQQCITHATQLHASYQIEQTDENGEETIRAMSLYRTENQIGHYFNNKEYGDWWSKNSNNKVMLLRYFPKYQQSIEYQQDEIQGIKAQRSFWQKKNQLISPELLSKMTIMSTEKQGCNTIEVMSYHNSELTFHVRWIANLNLLAQLDIVKGNDKISSWKLNALNTTAIEIKHYIDEIQRYQSTDYADIGDNESNPFLAEMIHQGFAPPNKIAGSGAVDIKKVIIHKH